jgi:hypothetical protein
VCKRATKPKNQPKTAKQKSNKNANTETAVEA